MLAEISSNSWRTTAKSVHYGTVKCGNITEELFTTRTAIEAAKKGQSLSSGTVITMEDYRDGKLFRYVVMEKRTGWGNDYPLQKRNGEWEFQAFNADKSTNRNENLDLLRLPQGSGQAGLRVYLRSDEERQIATGFQGQ